MLGLFEKEELVFKRNRQFIFNAIAAATQGLAYSGDFAKVVITQTAGVTATLTINGQKAGVTVSAVLALTGNTVISKELSQKFNDITSLDASFSTAPSLRIDLISPDGEPIENEVAVETLQAQISFRREFKERPITEQGKLPSERLIFRTLTGSSVQEDDFFTRSLTGKLYNVDSIEPILDAILEVHHREITCHEIA